MTTSRVTTSHTKKYEVTHFGRYSLVWFCDLGRISSVGLAQAFMVATLILSLRLRIAEAGHLAVFHQNLSEGKAVPLQYVIKTIYYKIIYIVRLLESFETYYYYCCWNILTILPCPYRIWCMQYFPNIAKTSKYINNVFWNNLYRKWGLDF